MLFGGLRKLQYRGYDSAGIAWHDGDTVRCVRSIGNLDFLESAPAASRPGPSAPTATITTEAGIGHTRWGTHGGVDERNAHPHDDATGRVRIGELVGHYAFVAICDEQPDTLVGVRLECPLVVGLGDGEQLIASSISAFHAYTRRVVNLRDGEIVTMTPGAVTVTGADGRSIGPAVSIVDWDEDRCDKQGYETFMLKEIHEQGEAVAQTLSHWRADCGEGTHPLLGAARARTIDRLVIVACGTSYHAGLAGRQAIERWARLPVDVETASEFRYRDPLVGPRTLVLGITQSGETADTLAAMRLARAKGAPVIVVTNAVGSQATREADEVLFTRARLEMGVAATKAFVAQVALLCELALHMATIRGTLEPPRLVELHTMLEQLPGQLDAVATDLDGRVRTIAERLAFSPFFLYLGRLTGLPVAMEGALKLKEISYIATDAYPAGEMKHGPIALLGPDTPVVCEATDEAALPKLLSNLSEVRARGAQVLAIAGEGAKQIAEHAEDIVYIPCIDPVLQVMLAVVPLQLLAYHIARTRGLNVDQPRNFVKTVTVE